MAIAGAGLLAYQAVAVAGWATSGPHQITGFRTHASVAWYAARTVEALVLVSMTLIVGRSIRDWRRSGSVTTDGFLVIGMLTAAFWDPVYNWVAPAWLYSSDFLNVNDWLGHAPGALNPDAGRMPWPIIIVLVGYPLWGVGFAILINKAMSCVQHRRPATSPPMLVAVAFLAGAAVTAAAFTIFELLGLMDAPGYRLSFLGNQQWLFFAYSGGLVFGGLACLRWFTDDDGRAVFERGPTATRPAAGLTKLFAASAACQIIVIVGWGLLTVPFSLLSSPYPPTHPDLISGLCDAPGITGTAYGPCPGTPGASLRTR